MKKVHVSRQARLVMQQVAKGTEPDQIALTDGEIVTAVAELERLGFAKGFFTEEQTRPIAITLTDEGEAYMGQNQRLRNPLPDDVRAGLIQLAVSVVSVALGFVLGRI